MIRKLLKRFTIGSLVRVACYLAIVSLLLMMWSVLHAAALPVVLGMSVGQGIGVIAFLCFAGAVLADARRASAVEPAPDSRTSLSGRRRDSKP